MEKNKNRNEKRVDEVYKPLPTNVLFLMFMLVFTGMVIIYGAFHAEKNDDFVVNELVGETPVRFNDAGSAVIHWKGTYHTDPITIWDEIFSGWDSFTGHFIADENNTSDEIDLLLGINRKPTEIVQTDETRFVSRIKHEIDNIIRLKAIKYETTIDFFTRTNVNEIETNVNATDIVTFELTDIKFSPQFLKLIKAREEAKKIKIMANANIVEAESNLKGQMIRHIKEQDEHIRRAKEEVEKAIINKENYTKRIEAKIRKDILDSLNKVK